MFYDHILRKWLRLPAHFFLEQFMHIQLYCIKAPAGGGYKVKAEPAWGMPRLGWCTQAARMGWAQSQCKGDCESPLNVWVWSSAKYSKEGRLREIKSIYVNPLLLSVPCPCIVAAAVKISDLKLAGMISNTKKVKKEIGEKTFRFARACSLSVRVPQKLAICLSYANDWFVNSKLEFSFDVKINF